MANQTTRPLKVFLCHASGDKPAVRDLYKRLIAEGVDAWLDEEKLLPGQDWNDEILRALQESDAIIICLSKISVSKEGYVQREIKEALEKAKEKPSGTIFVIPSRLDDCEIPNYLRQWQWVDLFEENGFARLLRSLKLRADRVGARIEPSGYEGEDKESDRRLDQLYTEGLAAFYTEDWDRAYQRFQAILRERPNHKNAAEKLTQAEQHRNLVKLYAQATEAYQSENWQAAIKALEDLLEKSADYKDAAHLLKDAKKQKQLGELYVEAKRLHAGQKWQAVIRVFDQIAGIDSAYPDPDDLLLSAQKEAAELKRLAELNDLYSQGIHKMDAGEWYEARSLLEQVHKAQTGFLDTERLLRKVENEILRVEEGRKRDAQVQMLYEQARKMARAGQWSKALGQMEEIQKLNNQFVDSDGLLEKAKAGVEREEQEAQQRRELAALYAEAISLLESKKYQEALEKWNAIQAIDPKYKDSSRVKSIAKRKLDELSRPEVVGRQWPKIITDSFRLEANIPVDREILAERLLLLSFAGVLIIHAIWATLSVRLNVWESSPILIFLYLCVLGGLYGAVMAFAFNQTFPNWQLKHSLTLVVGWALWLGIPVTLIIHGDLPGFPVYRYIALLFVATIKWARPRTQPLVLIIIFASWVLAWEAAGPLANHIGPLFDSLDVNGLADAFAIVLGLLFTFGMQTERSWEVLRTAFFGALGFAVGNYISYHAVFTLFPPEVAIANPIVHFSWGFIGGAILATPSRNTRRIFLSAGLCGIGLLLGYFIASVIFPIVAGRSYPEILQYQVPFGIGLGLGLGMLIRRASAVGVLAILGTGMFVTTSIPVFSGFFVRGALIGLVLGYAYGYMHKAKPPVNKSLITKPILVSIGIICFLASVLAIVTYDPTMYDDFNNPAHNGKFNTALWNAEINAGKIVQGNGLLTFELNTSGQIGLWAPTSDKPTYSIFIESKMMLDSTSTADAVMQASFGSEKGDTGCGIVEYTSGEVTQDVICSSELELPEIPHERYSVKITPGTWHLLRIELYPDTMTFVFLVDDKKIGSYVPQNPDTLKDLSYTPSVFLYSGTDSAPSAIGYVDYVKIGKIEE